MKAKRRGREDEEKRKRSMLDREGVGYFSCFEICERSFTGAGALRFSVKA